ITATAVPADALAFSGSAEYVALPVMDFSATNKLTFEAWVKPTDITSSGYFQIMRQDIAISNPHWLVSFQDFGTTLSFGLNTSSGGYTELDVPITPSYFTDGNWHHIAAVYDGSTKRLYVDGVQAGLETKSGSIVTGAVVHSLGRANYYGEFFKGTMDEVRYWNVARTQCEILSYMNCEMSGTPTGLVANYHFTQGIPFGTNTLVTTAIDAMGANNGTLTSFVLTGSVSNWVSPGGVISGSTTPATLSQTLNVKGNGNNVPMGTSTSTNNFTDFSTNSVRTFVAENIGSGTLYISNVSFSGAGASQFSVGSAPASSLAGSGSSSFTILFTPTVVGTSSAIVTVNSSDCSNPNYSFVITASASPASALHFDGGSGYVDLGAGSNLKPTVALTAEAWINAGNWPSVDQTFVGNTESNGWGILTTNVSGNLEGYVRRNGSWATVGTPLSGITAGWHHVALTYDGRYTKLYVDGIMKNMNDAGATYTVDYNPFNNTLIGAEASSGSSPVPGWAFTGSIDELRIWSTARTQCEILTYMNCEIPTTTTNLVANYHFNQGIPSGSNTAVTTLTDAAGSNTGTLVNVTLTGSVSNWVAPSVFANGYTLTSQPTATLTITGNGNAINPGSTATGTNNFTDFGSASTRTFVANNIASSGVLYINTVSISGGNAADFTLTTAPVSSVNASGNTNFVITFTPTALGTRTAIVSLFSSDCSNPVYSFVITASASPASALDFDNNNDYVNLGNGLTTLFDPLNTITLEAWVKPTSTVGLGSIVGNWQSPTSVMQFLLQRSGDKFCLHIDGGTGYQSLFSAPNTVSLNTWQHVAGVWDGSQMRLYINGVLQGVLTNTGSSFPTRSNNVMIGGNNVNEQLTGSIDEVRVWTLPRTQCEILQYMNCEITSTASGLVANYHFNQGLPSGNNLTENLLTDATGIYTGTLTNMNLTGNTSNWISPGGVLSGSTTPAVLNQTISLLGNGNAIPVGSTTGTLNFTDFGSSTNRVYTIHNSGTGVLYINPVVSITGAGAGDFSLSAIPASSISGTGNATFAISFIPSSLGTKTAVVTVESSDCTIPSYSFVISASPSSGAALNFDGSTGFASATVFNTNTNNITLQAKVLYTANTATNQVIVYNGNTSSSGYGMFVGQNGDLYLLYGGNTSLSLNYTITPNVWTYLSLVIESNKISFYVNGVSTTTLDPLIVGSPNVPTNAFCIGANHLGLEVFNGTIDEVLFWTRPLSQCEIQAYASCEISGTLTGLEANYHFNQGIASGVNSTVTTLTDASSNAHDLLLYGMTLSGPTSNWVTPGAVTSGSACSTYSAPEIAVVGGTTSLGSGDVLPSVGKDTDYGNISTSGNIVHTFTIQNSGNGSLSVSSITMSGADASSYLVGPLIPSSPIAAGNFAVFNVTFAPSSSGTKTAMVNINNSDCDEALFTYMLTGSGAGGQSFVFDGVDDYITCGNILTASYTKEAWIKIGTSTNGNNFISTGTGVTGSAFWAPGIYGYKLSAGHDGLWNQVQDATALSTNTWYHVAVTYDAPSTTMSLYKNGVLVASSNTVQPYTGSTPLQLGAYDGTYVVNGSMDEVRVWNRALCASEIVNNMSCEIQTIGTGLVANYHFNQGIG
ncbi:MAG: choice-of-anchor D domain-containing protein, partial [Bacteroidia bacterium]|nr:choice-of-anchor D domain-containing protein [Bacteroidia bacterium]